MENYEQKYKEALEKAKDYHKQLLDEDNPEWASEIEKIFPELAESEDEKIMKAFREYLTTFRDNYGRTKWYNDIKIDDALAWLEKQGRLMKALQISNSKIEKLVEENYYLKEN